VIYEVFWLNEERSGRGTGELGKWGGMSVEGGGMEA